MTVIMSKASIDHIEVEETAKADVVPPSAADKSAFWRIFKTDPDPAFLADLARINETDLDEARVKRMERRIDWLIIPALAVCYMVRCSIILVYCVSLIPPVLLCVRLTHQAFTCIQDPDA